MALKNDSREDCCCPGHMVKRLCSALEVGHKTAKAVLSVLKQQTPGSQPCLARGGRSPVTIPKSSMMVVQCGRLNKRVQCTSHVVLEPNPEAPWPIGLAIKDQLIELPAKDNGKIEVTIENLTDNDIVLSSRTTLDLLHNVAAIYPLQGVRVRVRVSEEKTSQVPDASASLQTQQPKPEMTDEPWDPPVDLSHLSEEQRQQVKQMLGEERDVFVRNDWDTGCIKDLEMHIQLTDNVPVQTTYNAIPKHLYQEVKTHIQDLLHRGWIQKSCSSYSSPVVCQEERWRFAAVCRLQATKQENTR